MSIERLRAAIAEHDSFGAISDDSPINLFDENYVAYELNCGNKNLTLGDLRAVLSEFDMLTRNAS